MSIRLRFLSSFVLVVLALVSFHPAFSQEWDSPTTENLRVFPFDLVDQEAYGFELSIAGPVCVVGATGTNQTSDGAAYVVRYNRQLDDWQEEQRLTVVNTASYSGNFGRSVATDGERILVGSTSDDDGEGAVFFFDYDEDASEWTEIQKLEALDAGDDDRFGTSVAIDGDTAVIGAFLSNDDGNARNGAAYVFAFDHDTAAWTEVQKLTASDAASEDFFGISLAISDGRILISAYNADVVAEDSGAAYVYEFDPVTGEWIETQKLVPLDGAANDNFGVAVDLHGDVAVVGSSGDDDLGVNSGSVYVFRYDSALEEWVQEQKLTNSDGGPYNSFGRRAQVNGSCILASANGHELNRGAAYLFQYDSANEVWLEAEKLTASDEAIGDRLGLGLAFSGDIAVLGSPYDITNSVDPVESGSIVFYRLAGPFIRGDVDGDGEVGTLTDSLYLIAWGFIGSDPPPCSDAADVNDDGQLSPLLDAIDLLTWGLLDGLPPPAPGPNECGFDPTDDSLDCETPADEFCA